MVNDQAFRYDYDYAYIQIFSQSEPLRRVFIHTLLYIYSYTLILILIYIYTDIIRNIKGDSLAFSDHFHSQPIGAQRLNVNIGGYNHI